MLGRYAKKMRPIKESLLKAKEVLSDFYEEQVVDIRLEEFDRSSKSIIVSVLLPNNNPGKGLMALSIGDRPYERVYKKIIFDAEGEVQSVKIFNK